MRDAYDDEEERRGRPVLWSVFVGLVVASIIAVGLTWRSAGFDRLLEMVGVGGATAVDAADVGAPAVDAGERIGDWFVACDAAAACSLTQTIRQAGMPAASWRIERNAAGDLVGVWTLPTGVMVGRGMQLALDDGKPSGVPYDSCAQSSCEVRAKLGPDFVELMRAAGKTGATVTLKGGATQTYGFSHDGLAAGLERLTAAMPQ
ncbi:MAG: invasion associated locus B family protein [Candidatus Kaistia colombiensis]|nr:MAG: invasion associated locus B family protein [Kaistia sp.]